MRSSYLVELKWKIKTIGILLFVVILFLHINSNAKSTIRTDSKSNKRLQTTIFATSGAYLGMVGYYYYLWYKDTPTNSFQWINDNSKWLQMDKVGHATTVYSFSEYSYHTFRWAGLDNNKAALLGASVGLANMISVEVFDGFHSKWGASWGDLLANTFGAVMFSSQQIVWHEQKLRLKFFYWPSDKYAPLNPAILGNTKLKRIVEDYNSQTYWLSANIASFISKPTKFPKWLNIAFGYGGRGLGVSPQLDDSGNILPDFIRTREYYLSMDVDLQRIPTDSKVLKTIFKIVGFIKVPFPALEYNKVDKLKWHWMYF